MSSDGIPATADVVIVGGGVVGASVAYHLAQAGVGKVVLLERDRLGCGTSWHSAANIAIVDVSARAFIDFYTYSRELFSALEEDTGQAVGWRETGRIQIATNDRRLDTLRHVKAVADANGVAAEIVDSQEVKRHLPILRTDDIIGALWTPSTGRVNATDLIAAYAKAARKHRAVILERVPVLAIERNGAGIAAVITPAGRVATRTVVNCAGLWAPKISEMLGVRLPIYANEHFYILTKPFAGIRSDMPAFRDSDAAIYGREEVGGLLLGCFEKRAKPIDVDALPEDFSFALLPEDWDQFEPYMMAALHRIPELQDAEVKMLLNGPESFTPDGKFLLGACGGVEGYYVLAGMNSSGVNFSAGAGRGLAELISGAAPSYDLTPFDPNRFARFHSNRDWLRERIAETPGFFYGLGGPRTDYETGRRLRRSPLHALLEARGMRFASVAGWEQPDLLLREGDSETDAREREWRALTSAVALFDLTAAGRFLLPWTQLRNSVGSHGVWDGLKPEQCRSVIIADDRGGGRTRALVTRLDSTMALVTVDAQREAIDASLFSASRQAGLDPAGLPTSGFAQILIAGPAAANLLTALAPEVAELSPGCGAPFDSGGVEGFAVRLSDSGHWLFTLHAEFACYAYERLESAASALGGGAVGRRTIELDRILRAIPSVGREIVPTIPVAALDTGSPPGQYPRLISAWSDVPLAGGEPLKEIDGRGKDAYVGFVTSAAVLPDGRTALMAYLERDATRLGAIGAAGLGVLQLREPGGG